MINADNFVSVAEAAKLLGLTRQCIYTRIGRGELPSTMILGRHAIDKADILGAKQAETRVANVEAELQDILSVKKPDEDSD